MNGRRIWSAQKKKRHLCIRLRVLSLGHGHSKSLQQHFIEQLVLIKDKYTKNIVGIRKEDPHSVKKVLLSCIPIYIMKSLFDSLWESPQSEKKVLKILPYMDSFGLITALRKIMR